LLTGANNYGDKITNKQLTNNGWIYFQSGLKIHWGLFDNGSLTSDKSGLSFVFNTPYTSFVRVMCNAYRTDGVVQNRDFRAQIYNQSLSSFVAGWYGNNARYLQWIAIGY